MTEMGELDVIAHGRAVANAARNTRKVDATAAAKAIVAVVLHTHPFTPPGMVALSF